MPMIRVFVALLLAALAGNASAGMLYYDPFLIGTTPANGQYATTAVLPGQNPTVSGANGTWVLNLGNVNSAVNFFPTATALSYPGLPTSGGSIESRRDGSGTVKEQLVESRPAAGQTIAASDMVYFSALVKYSSAYSAWFGVDFGSRDRFGIGFGTDGKAAIFKNTAAEVASVTSQVYAPDTTYFIVGRMIPNGNAVTDLETVEFLAINPTLPASEPLVPITSAQIDVWGDATGLRDLENFWIGMHKVGTANSVKSWVDEVRVGTTWADVVPVPEPATVAQITVVALTGLLWSLFRKRG